MWGKVHFFKGMQERMTASKKTCTNYGIQTQNAFILTREKLDELIRECNRDQKRNIWVAVAASITGKPEDLITQNERRLAKSIGYMILYSTECKDGMQRRNAKDGQSLVCNMTYVMVDVETDGPIPGDFSMLSLGAVIVEPKLDRTFYTRFKPISNNWDPEALKVNGLTREETLNYCGSFLDPIAWAISALTNFDLWLIRNILYYDACGTTNRIFFVSDNNGFDWQFVNWYFHHFLGRNPFGHSSINLGSLYKGLVKDMFQNFKHLRKTAHTHNPVDDARGNAEALLTMQDMGLKLIDIPFTIK
jgi:DNA polymerase III epsilon subunit-like protein